MQEHYDASYTDMLFYKNDVAFNGQTALKLGDATFLENRIGMKLVDVPGPFDIYGVLNRINFLGVGNEYHIHYTGTSLFDFNVSLTFWNTTSVDEIEEDIYDGRDGGKGLVRILAAESMPHTPFWHGMYQADSCAGQCGQSWFNTNWSSLISAGTGSFGFFDPDRSLHSGQVLHDALLKGYEPSSGMSLSSYVQDLTDLLGAVSKFQSCGYKYQSFAKHNCKHNDDYQHNHHYVGRTFGSWCRYYHDRPRLDRREDDLDISRWNSCSCCEGGGFAGHISNN